MVSGRPSSRSLLSNHFFLNWYNQRMTLTLDEVNHIAELARLALSDAEKERYRVQLSAILDYAARLQALDTSGIAPTASVLPPLARLRDDEVRPSLTQDETLANSPVIDDGQFRVPPVFGGGA